MTLFRFDYWFDRLNQLTSNLTGLISGSVFSALIFIHSVSSPVLSLDGLEEQSFFPRLSEDRSETKLHQESCGKNFSTELNLVFTSSYYDISSLWFIEVIELRLLLAFHVSGGIHLDYHYYGIIF